MSIDAKTKQEAMSIIMDNRRVLSIGIMDDELAFIDKASLRFINRVLRKMLKECD